MTCPARSLALRTCVILGVVAVFGAAQAAPPAADAHGIDAAGIDRSVAPGDDFFAYANGAWIKATQIPADRSSWGTGAILAELTAKRTADLIRELRPAAPAGSDARKIGDYYASFMDEARIEQQGLEPLEPELARIAAITDRGQLARALGATLRADVDVLNNTNLHTDNLFGLWVAQDLDDPSRYSPFLLQGGLGMPDRDYYLNPSARMAEIRDKYQAHIAALLELAQHAGRTRAAGRIFELERRIAAGALDPRRVRGRAEGQQPLDAPGLRHARAGPRLARVLRRRRPRARAARSSSGSRALSPASPRWSRASRSQTWKDYLRFHALEHDAPLPAQGLRRRELRVLRPRPLRHAAAARALEARASTPPTPRSARRSASSTSERYFPPSEKARAEEMVHNLLAAFAARIDRLELDGAADASEQAKAKLATLKVGVGYPDKWRDYSALEVVRGDAFGNAERAEPLRVSAQSRQARPAGRSRRVGDEPATGQRGEPAGDERAELPGGDPAAAVLRPAARCGAGLRRDRRDDRPRDQPQLRRPGRAVRRQRAAQELVDPGGLRALRGRRQSGWSQQFDAYQPFPDVHVNGKQTLSENIADVAGLSASYDA